MEDRKTHFSKHGMYAGYDKKHKERDALDFYSTPTKEVVNILKTIKLSFEGANILEPCIGGGHMMEGIGQYLEQTGEYAYVCGTDIMDREYHPQSILPIKIEYGLDFLNDDYTNHLPFDIDYIIMNPPYSTIEPFVMKSLSIAKKGILMLGRLQFLEGKSRYENILEDYPPSDVWVYVDRISCDKNGTEKMGAVNAYAWFYWNLENDNKETKLHWIRRV